MCTCSLQEEHAKQLNASKKVEKINPLCVTPCVLKDMAMLCLLGRRPRPLRRKCLCESCTGCGRVLLWALDCEVCKLEGKIDSPKAAIAGTAFCCRVLYFKELLYSKPCGQPAACQAALHISSHQDRWGTGFWFGGFCCFEKFLFIYFFY